MEWFKHDSKAHQDAKIRRLKNKYGIAAYGLYFHILERVILECGNGNTSLMLEDDFFILEQDTGLEQSTLKSMVYDMVQLRLLYSECPEKIKDPDSQPDDIFISCPKLAKRLAKSQVAPKMREFVDQLQEEHEGNY